MKGFQSLLLSTIFVVSFAFNSNANIVVRQTSAGTSPTTALSTPAVPTPTTTTDTTSSTTTTTSTTPTDTKTSDTTTTTPTTTSTTPTTTPTQTTTTPLTNAPPTTTTNPATVGPVVTTQSGGTVVTTIMQTSSSTTSTSSASGTPTAGSDSDSDSSSGLGTGSIIGLAVAGGVAVIGIIAFFVWKFTRKRFSDFDDNEAIKWPDLNTHGAGANDSHPLPVNSTGRSGFDTGSDGELSRVPSNNYSTPELGPDPYAVPPLPHLNPNQPYRDDPAAAGAYYDPYHGPIPGTIEHNAPGQEWGGEVIPMTQMSGRMSPGPHAAYGAEPQYDQHYDQNAGRMSPGPHAAYGGEPGYDHSMGRQSPGPQAAYAGRTSPGPQASLGGRMSPGPHSAYGGASSPQPPVGGGYDAYAGRR